MGKLVPPVTVNLDRQRMLVCDMAAVQKLEEWSGIDLFALINQAGSGDSAVMQKSLTSTKVINAMLAAFMLREDPTMTPTKAGQLVSSVSLLKAASEASTEAFQRFFEVSGETSAGGDPENPATP